MVRSTTDIGRKAAASGQSYRFKSWRTYPQEWNLGRHLSQYWPLRLRCLTGPTINHPNHKAGIVICAGGEIGFEISQLLPLQFKFSFEGKGCANTWLIGG